MFHKIVVCFHLNLFFSAISPTSTDVSKCPGAESAGRSEAHRVGFLSPLSLSEEGMLCSDWRAMKKKHGISLQNKKDRRAMID